MIFRLSIHLLKYFKFLKRVARGDVLLAVPVVGLDFESHQAFGLGSVVVGHCLVEEFGVGFDVEDLGGCPNLESLLAGVVH